LEQPLVQLRTGRKTRQRAGERPVFKFTFGETLAVTRILSGAGTRPRAQEPSEICGDDELTERVRNDDVDAYRILVERNIDRAYGLALRILGNSADADDVVQDAFVKAWIHRQNWQSGRAQFGTWLYRVVVNRCIDLKRAPKGVWIEDVPEPLDDADDAGEALHKREVFGKLDAALGRLPPLQRIVLVLSYHEEMSNGEIAELLDTTVSAVESQLKRARRRLRELLRRSEGDVRRLLGTA
jgi:RNA polymerase sigma-70 factor (ECF subfamily)